ncbi:conserved exported protein of unknown function [Cupriavidus taiwanensis]|uniref:tripartite tricarboxylate transporter substrate binding protein n=1 Tax=Cupriavidus taiwanensis TaxID=164546 RepID=UPI000E103C20|nr:tripartite tricarboxylate transporter substrate binding protein [Cupriavidus taiwanensis]SPA40730.1 conserved exported hypothetical protein [Cupriavidus taiwanensis]SPA41658.1 conserved exported protein of unknown function [Cupriavidus taiwanensis]
MKYSARLAGIIALSSFAVTTAAWADDYPNRPITLVIPWAAGGSTDVVFRTLANAAARRLGQPFVVENKPGVGGTLGAVTMSKTAKPDGYTIAQVSVPLFRLPLIQKSNWDPEKDFTYIVGLMGYTFAITAAAQSPYKSWADVVSTAKKHPGTITYGTSGQSSTPHLGMEQISAMAGINLAHVPFKSGSETSVALLGGHTQLQVEGGTWIPLVKSGKARLLAVWTEKRSKLFPDAPTLKELGYPLVITSPIGLAGPRGMDPKIVKKLQDAFHAAMGDPEVQKIMDDYLMQPDYKTSEDFRKFMLQEQAKEKALVQRLGLSMQ